VIAPVARPAPAAPPLGSLPYVVVDVETTGGRARYGDRITEVAAVVVREGRVDQVFETLVNPERSIPPSITALTNISWNMVRDAPTFREVAPRLLDVLEGRIFVAHNATFDWNFICAEVERATGERLEGERVCTVRLARRLLPQLRRRSLDYVCLHYGVENEARHRAGGDALATAHVLQRLLHDAAGRGIATWDDLRALLHARTGRAKRRRRASAMPRPVDRDTTA
jgi:DNA polymerase-3 subunit epsilon